MDAQALLDVLRATSGEVEPARLQERFVDAAVALAQADRGVLLLGSEGKIAPADRVDAPASDGIACCVPLLAGTTLVGAIELERAAGAPFTADEIAPVAVLACQTGALLERACLQREQAKLRERDELLRQSEELYRKAIAQAGAVPYVLDYGDQGAGYGGRYAFMGDEILALTGYSAEAITPQLWRDTIVQEFVMQGDQTGLSEPDALRRTRAGEFVRWRCDYRIRTRSGEERWISDASVEVVDEDGRPRGSIGMLQDITERKRAEEERKELEEQLRQAQKMEAVGRLAGGIAHDFNNLLTAIGGYSMLLLDQLAPDDPQRADVEEIAKAGELAAALTQQLLVFSRRQVLQPQVLDLNEVVTDVETLVRRLVREDVTLVTELAPAPVRVSADPGRLSQVVVNLVVNAEAAMPSGGRLMIATADVALMTSDVRGHAAGRYAQLAVIDTGVGMDEETRARIFEPFFTTKQRGKGTGLGLATVFGIVEQSGGHVAVSSRPGEGTRFDIYLPLAEGAPAADHGLAGHEEALSGRETVLLVEDEPAVRNLARDVLRLRGYTVIEASDGEEAVRVAASSPSRLDLLVTDLVMPGMSGRELAERMRVGWPNLRVLFISGYTDDAIFRFGALEPGQAFLQKPFTPAVLARRVRETLELPPALAPR